MATRKIALISLALLTVGLCYGYVFMFSDGSPSFQNTNDSLVHSGNVPKRNTSKAMSTTLYMTRQLETLRQHSSSTQPSLAGNNVAFVTAADYTHFNEARDSIASIQKNLPNQTIFFYDLGLRAGSVQEVKKWCRVSHQLFNFSRYPPHVHRLGTYAWKPLIIQEVLQKHKIVIWFDASVRIKCPTFLSQLVPTMTKSGIALVDYTGHSSFAATDPRMYEYISVSEKLMQATPMIGASFIALSNTRSVFDYLIKWWVRCALTNDCISPKGSTNGCRFGKDRNVTYARCHRYDQSALNLLLADHFKGRVDMYFAMNTCLSVERAVTSHFKLQYCPPK